MRVSSKFVCTTRGQISFVVGGLALSGAHGVFKRKQNILDLLFFEFGQLRIERLGLCSSWYDNILLTNGVRYESCKKWACLTRKWRHTNGHIVYTL